ncbi:MAG: DUF4384 domain-containing protein [Anaeromyxobacter sp.]
MTRCPSELALEAHLLQADPAVEAHLAGCARCAARLAGMERDGDTFRREVFPATVDAVTGADRRPQRRWWLLAPLAAAAAAAALVLVVPRQPPDDYVGLKGGDLTLGVWLDGAKGARAVVDGEGVPAAAGLRFRVRAAGPCRLWLLSIDAAGQVSRLYPASGEGGGEVDGVQELPGGVVLDGKAGPERLFAICTPGPLPWPEVAQAARGAGAGAGAVREARRLEGLPSGAWQATVLVEKRP